MKKVIHVIGVGVGVGLVEPDEDEETRPDFRHKAPLNLERRNKIIRGVLIKRSRPLCYLEFYGVGKSLD